MDIINSRFKELQELICQFEINASGSVMDAAIAIANAFKKGNTLFTCGNGGSAADSQHFAAEFVNVFSKDLKRDPLPAIALSTDTSILTSIANDSEFSGIFSRQLAAYGKIGDVLVSFTTSGSSENCLKAVKVARDLNMVSIAFTREGAKISEFSSISIEVPSDNTQHIQECHLLAYHVIAEIVEDILFRRGTP